MPPQTLTGSRGSLNRPGRAVISGYVWRLIREQVGLTQDALAEVLGVSSDAVAGWETGRRPLTALSAGQMIVYRHRLLHLGAPAALIAAFGRALEADVLLASVLGDTGGHDINPLGAWVMQRELVETLAWPLTGTEPETLRAISQPRRQRRGPVPAGPELRDDERDRFFHRLRRTVEEARGDRHFLLRRQALYLGGYDTRSDAAVWLAEQQRQQRPDTWLTRWLTARSVASVATRHGDLDRIAYFVQTLVDDDRAEAANLAYWAYWVGESPHLELSDDFMASGQVGSWDGRILLEHLLPRLTAGHGYLDLYVHTVWALLAARPALLRSTPASAQALRGQLDMLLDGGGVPAHARREIDAIRYAMRLAQA